MMMWTRKELKERAKDALKRNYWKVVLVSLIAILIGGGASSAAGSAGGNSVSNGFKNGFEEGYEEATGDDLPLNHKDDIVIDKAMDSLEDMSPAVIIIVVIVFIVIMLIVVAAAIAVDVFLLNPILVGISRFMLKGVDGTTNISELGYTFDHNYKNGMKTMFFRDLYIALWSLLFIIPGIYKAYQYRMVPYILAENPDMPYKDVLQMSKDMMNGQKWKAFVLDLSFILWHILGAITCGIAEILYVAPYVYLTNAAFYRRLSNSTIDVPNQM